MTKYSKKAQEKIETVMHEFKHGKLKSGKGGKGGIVKSRDQAIAIGISEAREAGLKVPDEKQKDTEKAPAKKRTRKAGIKASREKS
jgi:hypothetical protein